MSRFEPSPRRIVVEGCADLPAVPPGEKYQTTCSWHEAVVLLDVLVRDFVLDTLRIGNLVIQTHERASQVACTRLYQLDLADPDRWRLATVTTAMDVSLILRNDTDRPLPVRQAAFEEDR